MSRCDKAGQLQPGGSEQVWTIREAIKGELPVQGSAKDEVGTSRREGGQLHG
jgi:hypothetical protein